jgi:ribonuclease HI
MEKKKIFTDGACINNGLPNAVASWSYIVTDFHDNIITASTGKIVGIQDNNRAELHAFINALQFVKHEQDYFKIYVDFEPLYLYCNGKAKARKNLDLYKTIDELLAKCSPRVEVAKVKAHRSSCGNIINIINNITDKIAKKSIELMQNNKVVIQ